MNSFTYFVNFGLLSFKQAHADHKKCSKGLQAFLSNRSLFMEKNSLYMSLTIGNLVILSMSHKEILNSL